MKILFPLFLLTVFYIGIIGIFAEQKLQRPGRPPRADLQTHATEYVLPLTGIDEDQ